MSAPNPEALTPDRDLEFLIDEQALRLHTVDTPNERRMAWDELRRLHTMRSPERIRDMEEERGLA